MPDQFPSHWTPEMKAEAQRRMGGSSDPPDEFPSHWTPAMKDAARARMAEPEQPRVSEDEAITRSSGWRRTVADAVGALPAGQLVAPMMRRDGPTRAMVNLTTRTAPMIGATMVGGPAGAAVAAGLGAGGSAARDVVGGRPVSGGAAATEGAIEGVLGAVSPAAQFVGPLVKRGASAALRGITGIETKVGADAVLNAGRGGLTPANAEALAQSAGQPGMPRADTARRFGDAVKRYTSRGDKSDWSGAIDAGLAFTSPWLLGAKKAVEYGVAKGPRIGSEAAQLAHRAGRGMENVGGQPAQVARFLRLLLGGDEPE